MDVFLMIRRHKTTIFLDAKENTTVMELKRMIEGITKKLPTDQRLYNKDDVVSCAGCLQTRLTFDKECVNNVNTRVFTQLYFWCLFYKK
jgi:hypothetical protein